MKAAIYIRKSREEKDKPSHRLTVQREQLPAYAQTQGWQIVIYDDGHASAAQGKTENLKERARLEADIRAGKINIILTIELSRLSRDDSLQDYVAWLDLCSRHSVRLATMSRILDPAQHSDWMLLLMEGGFSSVEMRVLKGRMKEGYDQAFRIGKFLGGQVPPPYRLDKNSGLPVVDPVQLLQMQQIWTMAETTSVREIAGKTGKPLISIRRMLADPRLLYCLAQRKAPTGEIIECQWDPCITADQVERIKANRVSRKSGYSRSEAAGLLSNMGFFNCSFCGRSIRAWRGVDNRYGKAKPFAYYGCKANEHKNQCPQSRMIQQAEIDNRVITNMLGILAKPELLHEAWQQFHSDDDTATEIQQLKKIEGSLKTKKERLVTAISEDIITFADAKTQIKQIETQLQDISNRRAVLTVNQQHEPSWNEITITWAEFDQLDTADKRELLQLCISNIRLHRNHAIIEYRFPRNSTGSNLSKVNLPGPVKTTKPHKQGL